MARWARQSVHEVDKNICTKLIFLLEMPKKKNTPILVLSSKWKFAPSPRLHPQSDHTQTSQNSLYGIRPVYRERLTTDFKNNNLAMLVWRKFWHTSWNQLKLSQVSESSTYSLQTRYVFSCLPPSQRVMSTNLLPVITTELEPSYTHSC